MATTYEIPLTPSPQVLTVDLAGVTYTLRLTWNLHMQTWVLDISTSEEVPILSGVPLVTGTNLFEQYDHLSFGGILYTTTDHDANAPPSFDNLGIRGHLYFYVP